MGFVIILFFVNLAISALNAWGCGKSWNETKYIGGFAHFMNWMGAIMAACGFTWCNMIILAFVGANWPVMQDDGTTAMLLDQESLQAFCELGYLVIIGPVIGSGIAITVHSWMVWWRTRRLADGAVAGWNTFADIYNIGNAISNVPSFTEHLGAFFKGDDKKGAIVIGLVLLAVFGGILTTYLIVTRTAASTASERALDARMRAA